MNTETSKYRHLTRPFCYRADGEPGCGIDLASQGDPVVPWAWQLDLPPAAFAHYNSGHRPAGPIQIFGDAFRRFAEGGSLDFIYASHILEDAPIEKWPEILDLWRKHLKVGGVLIILVPERDLWAAAINAGQTPNCAHCYEPKLGDVSKVAVECGFHVEQEKLTEVSEGDYSILAVLRRRA